MEKDISRQKKADMDIFLSDKIYFQDKSMARDKMGQLLKNKRDNSLKIHN